jgi:hypothetical protein
MIKEIEKAAVHEAGHGVLATVTDQWVRSIHINEDGNGICNSSHHESPDSIAHNIQYPSDVDRVHNHMFDYGVYCFSGYAAEWKLTGKDSSHFIKSIKMSSPAFVSDFEGIRIIMNRCNKGFKKFAIPDTYKIADFRKLWRITQQLMNDERVWTAILKLSDVLLRKRQVNEEELLSIPEVAKVFAIDMEGMSASFRPPTKS